ncbi:MAG: ribose 5-phosphate isomerase B [Candidatus Omnitrophica bacterium]|nr:ribose 5-phosphate isomerase B [Candidatus Omnitrophota bacterium]
MRIFIGADHRGHLLKEEIKTVLAEMGHDVDDKGTHSEDSCDYPDSAYAVASHVARTEGSRGVLVCMSGIGQSIAANKVPGAYAALCYNKEAAAFSREHNNANILVLGAKFIKQDELKDILETWLSTEFEGGRHQQRVDKIKSIEEKLYKAA